jgi:putative pre-16S rRNA nuclease
MKPKNTLLAKEQRILAIDFGTRRIGLAISDPLAIIASGIGSFENDKEFIPNLLEIIESKGVVKIIVGMPLTLRGEEGKSAKDVRAFIEKLNTQTSVVIETLDERFTSVLAADTIRQMGVGKKKRERNKGKVDELSAVHLLQGYLQSQSST